jgi:hypothetical protein
MQYFDYFTRKRLPIRYFINRNRSGSVGAMRFGVQPILKSRSRKTKGMKHFMQASLEELAVAKSCETLRCRRNCPHIEIDHALNRATERPGLPIPGSCQNTVVTERARISGDIKVRFAVCGNARDRILVCPCQSEGALNGDNPN